MENEAMYKTLLELYKNGWITMEGLDKAVKLHWITKSEELKILGSVAKEPKPTEDPKPNQEN